MNYIREINAFYDWLETNRLSLSAIALWHALMHINNKAAWTDEFAVALSVLCVKTNLSPRGVTVARNELKLAGRITWRSRKGNQSAIYHIISLSEELQAIIADNYTDNTTNKCANNHADNGTALNKLNKTENKDNNNPPVIPPDITETERELLNQLQAISGWPYIYEKDLAYIRQLLIEYPTINLLEKIKDYSVWLLDNPIKKNGNPRSQFRNWCKKAIEWGNNRRPKVINGGRNQQREEEKDFGWHREQN